MCAPVLQYITQGAITSARPIGAAVSFVLIGTVGYEIMIYSGGGLNDAVNGNCDDKDRFKSASLPQVRGFQA